MNDAPMTPAEEHEFYARPENQVPQGPPRRRKAPMTAPIPVRFPPDVLDRARAAAEADDRSLSSWIRRAVTSALEAERP